MFDGLGDFLETWRSELISFFLNKIIVPLLNTFHVSDLLPSPDNAMLQFFSNSIGYVNIVLGYGVLSTFITYFLSITELFLGIRLVFFLYDKVTSIT